MTAEVTVAAAGWSPKDIDRRESSGSRDRALRDAQQRERLGRRPNLQHDLLRRDWVDVPLHARDDPGGDGALLAHHAAEAPEQLGVVGLADAAHLQEEPPRAQRAGRRAARAVLQEQVASLGVGRRLDRGLQLLQLTNLRPSRCAEAGSPL